MDMLKSANLALRLLLELCALAAVGYWGARSGQGLPMKIALAVGTLVLFAVIWGTLIAPKSAVQLAKPAKFVLGLVFLELAAIGLAVAGQRPLAIAYAVVIALNAALLAFWRQ